MKAPPQPASPPSAITGFQRLVAALALAFLVGGAAGYFAGHRVPSTAPSVQPAPGAGAPSMSVPRAAEAPGAPESGGNGRSPEAQSVDGDITGPILAAVRARDYFRRRHDIYEVGQQLGPDTIRAAMEATQHFSKTERDNTQYALLARWLELDPAAAYQWVGALPAQGQRSDLMQEFFHSLGLKDPATALSFLNQYKADPNRGEDYTYSVFQSWAINDPVAAVDAALNLPKKDARSSALSVALGSWTRRDPQGALARVAQITDADLRRRELQTVLSSWAETDPQAAASHAQSLPAGKERNDALASVVSGAAVTDPVAAMRLVEQLPAGTTRSNTISQIVSQIGYRDPKVAAEFVLALPPGQQRNSTYQVVDRLARQDRAAALEWAGRLGSAEARTSAMQRIVQQWSSDDPKGAAEYCAANTLAAPENLGAAVANWSRDDPSGALAWAGALADSTQREVALVSGISVLGGSDPHQAANLATTLLSGEKQAQALGRIASAWAIKDPNAAAAWAGQLSDPTARMNAISNVAGVWVRQDPAAAAAWAGQSAQAGALSSIAREWASQDSVGAAKWLDTLPAGDARDSAVSNFSQVAVDTDPEGAAAWAATISKPQQRENAISNLMQQWKRTDPKAADAWLRATPALSDEIRNRMLKSGY